MNETAAAPDPIGPPREESLREFVFWWIEEKEGRELDVDGELEIIEVQRSASAKIIEPEPGKVVEGSFFLWSCEHKDGLYAVLDMAGNYYAIRTDVVAMASDGQLHRMRSVVLDGSNRSLAWEVLRQESDGVWRPIELQHLRPRTAPAEQWLAEIGPVLTRLSTHERKLMARWQALGQPPRPGRLREPSIPTPQGSAPPAPQDRPDTCHLASPADLKPPEPPESVMSLTQSTPTQGAGQPGAQTPSPSVVGKLNDELIKLADQLREAHAMVRHLRQQRGSPVTLLQTGIQERRVELLPTMPPELWLALRETPGYWMRL